MEQRRKKNAQLKKKREKNVKNSRDDKSKRNEESSETGKELYLSHDSNDEEQGEETLGGKQFSRRKIRPQPTTSWADFKDIVEGDTASGKDFEILESAPISQGGHFAFKVEKEWELDVPKYTELFSLDINKINAAINCIPFNKYIDLPDKYFSKDELTEFHNTAEQAQKHFKRVFVDEKKFSSVNAFGQSKEAHSDSTKNPQKMGREDTSLSISQLEEDLDDLLSLEKPTTSQSTKVLPKMPTLSEPQAPVRQIKTKPHELENWLDNLLGED